ncbi:MAG TPA: amino acid permease, partial [Aquella sp.]|nr:amino acid permease [Aquella sp.]
NRRHLAHSLKSRHILMIALGSAIGTGLFFGAGESIKLAGPSILLSYAIGGIIMYIVIRALGEMTVHAPNAGSFSYYAYTYIGNYAGFIAGWNYWFNYIIVSMLELTATTMFLDYWFPHASHWIVALNILIVFTIVNLMNVKLYGEFEFWFAGIKVVVIIALIILGLYLIISSNNNIHNSTSINNLWSYGGFFAHGYNGFLLSFVVVIFSFGGTELVGITAGEAENPHKTIPMAINGIIVRIIIFYIATLAIVLCLYPWSKIDSNISPFVDVFSKIGIPKAAAVMNFVAITAALSSLNSGIYGTARMAYGLSKQQNAPKILGRLNSNGIPYMATLFSLFFVFITVVLNYLYPKQIFGILLSVATIAAIINWVIILITQIVFRKKVGVANIKYKMPFYPLTSIIAIIFFAVIIITMTQMKDMAMAIYIAPIWLLILSIGYWLKNKIQHKEQ